MKKLFKLFCLLITASLIASMCVFPAAAAPRVDTEAYFYGLERGFVFMENLQPEASDLFPMFKNVMPGDVFTQYIEVKNRTRDFSYIDVYLRAVPHDATENPLSPEVAERETVESMQDFLSQLQLKVWDYQEDRLIYEASPDKTAQLTENVFLTRLRYNRASYIKLELTVPPELSSEYAYRAGEMDWVFHAECFVEGGGGGSEGGGGTGEGGDVIVPSNSLTVTKVWDDGDVVRPVSVTVKLLCDGKAVDTRTLNGRNQWTYTWSNLDKSHKWTVREDVPAGYTATYDNYGDDLVVITNKKPIPPETPDKPVTPGKPTDTDLPGGGGKPGMGDVGGASGGGGGNPGMGDVVETTDRDEDSSLADTPASAGTPTGEAPSVTDVPAVDVEPDVADTNGSAEVTDEPSVTDGVTVPVVPVLPAGPDGAVSVTVLKKFAGDEESTENRPIAVTATLFNGSELLETVMLGEHNQWAYTWEGLDPDGQWRVIETAVPDGYSPSYEVNKSGTVIITNTATLIKTGQTKWHIPVLMGAGLVLVGVGLMLVLGKRKENEN